MDLKRCEYGHFYDAGRFKSCPHCDQTTVATETVPVPPETIPAQGIDAIIYQKKNDDAAQTIGYFGNVTTEPVVGWLVVIEGSNLGKDFKLKSGRNFIGRSREMDVSLSGDFSVSREKHAIILYEPRSNVFLVQTGDAKELFYLNDKVVLAATEIKAYDILSLGATKLLFIPCCSEQFYWDMVKPKTKE